MHFFLKKASELLKSGDIDFTADTLHKVLNNPDFFVLSNGQHDIIIDEARNYGIFVKMNLDKIKTQIKESPNLLDAEINNHNAAFDVKTPVEETNKLSDSDNNFN